MVVADGMGGHPHGELAAQIAVEHFGAAFQREACPRLADPAQLLARSAVGAHAAILREAQRMGFPEAPRTVVVACVVQEAQAWWMHVGDCRFYLVREARVLLRTRDHTVAQQLVDEGLMHERALRLHPARNRLLQCLGGYQAPQPDAATARLAKNDLLLLCSDGFWGPLAERELTQALTGKSLAREVAALAALAERRAGRQCDNVSVLAMAWGGDDVRART